MEKNFLSLSDRDVSKLELEAPVVNLNHHSHLFFPRLPPTSGLRGNEAKTSAHLHPCGESC